MTLPVETTDTSSFDDDPAIERANQRMLDEGETIEEKQIVDYFAEPITHRFDLPDGIQYFEYQELLEGGKAKYERKTNRDIRVQRSTGDARLSVDAATQRQELIRLSVVGANVYAPDKHTGKLVKLPFNRESSTAFWDRVFQSFPAKIIQNLHEEIVKVNEWMAADDDIEALKEQREQLDDRIKRAEEVQAKSESS